MVCCRRTHTPPNTRTFTNAIFSPFSSPAYYTNHNWLVTSQIVTIIAFIGLFFACLLIVIFLDVFLGGILLLTILGFPTFLMSFVLWCYKMKNCTLIVHGIFSLSTGLGCALLGMYLILHPNHRESFYYDPYDWYDEYYDDYYGYEFEHEIEDDYRRTVSSWGRCVIMILIDGVFWFVSSFTVFYFYCKNRSNLTDTAHVERVSPAINEESQPQQDHFEAERCVWL